MAGKNNDKKHKQESKNMTASEMGKIGGPLGGVARAKSMSKKQLSASGRKAARARWDKTKKGGSIDNA
jgi:hypothetical protein